MFWKDDDGPVAIGELVIWDASRRTAIFSKLVMNSNLAFSLQRRVGARWPNLAFRSRASRGSITTYRWNGRHYAD